MGANPMQKMKRNSILTGLIIGLIIGLIMCAGVYLFLSSSAGSTVTSGKNGTVTVCVLNKTIKSGTTITEADVSIKKISKDDAPTDATTSVLNSTAKIELTAGTILAKSMLNTTSEQLTDDLREQEYNMITLPTQLSAGDFIDIRLQLPNGGDYIVIAKKQVLRCNATTIWLNMYEEEIDLMSNAIIEYYIMAGSKLYATTYVEAGSQKSATGTYVPNKTVSDLISANPNFQNVTDSARYSDALKNIRNNNINTSLSQYSDSAVANIEKNMKDEIEALKESREAYFGALNSAK